MAVGTPKLTAYILNHEQEAEKRNKTLPQCHISFNKTTSPWAPTNNWWSIQVYVRLWVTSHSKHHSFCLSVSQKDSVSQWIAYGFLSEMISWLKQNNFSCSDSWRLDRNVSWSFHFEIFFWASSKSQHIPQRLYIVANVA